jgi:hypothetical protein
MSTNIVAAIASTLPPGSPPFYRRIIATKKQGKGMSVELEMFDGQPGTLVIEQRGPCACFRWNELPGGDCSLENGEWIRVADTV